MRQPRERTVSSILGIHSANSGQDWASCRACGCRGTRAAELYAAPSPRRCLRADEVKPPGRINISHLYYARDSSQRLQFPSSLYPSTCLMVQRLTSRRLASSRWLTPLDPSSRMYSRCCSVRLGRRPGKRPSVRAFACPATECSLIELRHYSLNASTIWSWSLLWTWSCRSFSTEPKLNAAQAQVLGHLRPAGRPCKRRR